MMLTTRRHPKIELAWTSRQRATPPQPQTGAAVLIMLRIEPGEPITGALTSDNRSAAAPFCGWMELIAAINARRDA